MSKGDPTTDRETGILSAGNKSLSRQFLLLFLPLCALIVAGAVLLARSSIDAELIQLRAHEERAIHLGNQQLQFARLERGHHLRLFGIVQFAVHQTDTQFRKSYSELLICVQCCLQL